MEFYLKFSVKFLPPPGVSAYLQVHTHTFGISHSVWFVGLRRLLFVL